MTTKLLAFYRQLKGSYWFIPGICAFLAIVLAFGSLRIDRLLEDELFGAIAWIGETGPEGARAILTTIGASMISVAGIVFSITIAATVFASAQYGPHIIPEFMRDRSNQATLGIFIATFVYCIMALYRVHAGEKAFVPHLTIILALVFAAASLIMFIYFIHHILETLHVSNVIARLGRDLIASVERRFPTELGHGKRESDGHFDLPEGFLVDASPVLADGTGYIHTLSANSIFAIAVEHHLLVRLVRRPGDFVARERPLAYVWPPENAPKAVKARIRDCYAWGAQKTQDQDVGFLLDQLTGITARALSPGINDPYTAIDTIHWMGAALGVAGRAPAPATVRRDEDGHIRVIAKPVTFPELADLVFDRIRPYVSADPNATLAMLTVIGDILFDIERRDFREALVTEARRLRDACDERLGSAQDLGTVHQRVTDLEACLRNDIDRFRAGERYRWLEGRA